MSKRAAKQTEEEKVEVEDDDSVTDEHIRPHFPAVSASNTTVSYTLISHIKMNIICNFYFWFRLVI